MNNFNKRINIVEDGFIQTSKMLTVFDQAKELFNRNSANILPTPPQPINLQPNVTSEFFNIESKPVCSINHFLFS